MERFEALHQQYLTSESQLSEERKSREAMDKHILSL
jgi:hypothetical protein